MLLARESLPVPEPWGSSCSRFCSLDTFDSNHRRSSFVGTLSSRLYSLVFCSFCSKHRPVDGTLNNTDNLLQSAGRSCSSRTGVVGTFGSRHSYPPPSHTVCSVVRMCRDIFCSHCNIRSWTAGNRNRCTRTGLPCRRYNTLGKSPPAYHRLCSSCRLVEASCIRCSSYTSCQSEILYSLCSKCSLHAHLRTLYLDRSCKDVPSSGTYSS